MEKEPIQPNAEPESEDVVENVEALIHKDKNVLLPIESTEVDEKLKKVLLENIGMLWPAGGGKYNFIDKDGNVATFDLFSSKMKNGDDARGQLEALGFKITSGIGGIPQMLDPILDQKRKDQEKKFDL
ncbi:MAG TPA: hypothetical protein VMR99_02915 [Candidatus Paceibacterota bacterium]|nr:hypothetical protein [Candidatus Paceibacterota bacterium]